MLYQGRGITDDPVKPGAAFVDLRHIGRHGLFHLGELLGDARGRDIGHKRARKANATTLSGCSICSDREMIGAETVGRCADGTPE